MRKIQLILLLLVSVHFVFAQEEPQKEKEQEYFLEKPAPKWQEKLHYGGNIWLGFFGAFYVDVSPMVGFDITNKGTVAGVGGTLIYQGTFNQGGEIMAGPRVFVRQAVWRSIFAQAEYEYINALPNRFYSSAGVTNPTTTRKWEGSPLIGAGFYQGRTRQQKGSFIALMYNLGYPNRGFISPQGIGGSSSPIIFRLGFFM